MSAVEELAKICASLPATKVEELVDFARFLEAHANVGVTSDCESPGDAAWEKIIASNKPRPKLDAFAAAAMAEEPATPLKDRL